MANHLTSKNNLLIHVGYHRAGSKWLQKKFFNNSNLGFFEPLPRSFIDREIIRTNGLFFNPALEKFKISNSNLIPIISHERLSGSPHAGGYDSKELADKLKQLWPTAKILIVIREQNDMIRSLYSNYVKAGGVCSLDDYLHPPRRSYRLPHFEFQYLMYDKLIDYYQQLFGLENVIVLPYELFARDPHQYLTQICHFVGIAPKTNFDFEPINASQSSLANAIQRIINPFIIRDPANGYSNLAIPGFIKITRFGLKLITKIAPQDWHLPQIKRIIGDDYRLSNQTTQQLTNLDLKKYNYNV